MIKQIIDRNPIGSLILNDSLRILIVNETLKGYFKTILTKQGLIELGNSLVRTLMASDQTKVLMKKFVNWITDLNIIVVLEGLTVKEHIEHIKCLDFRNKDLIYVDADNELHQL